jgi:hypothetical protein
LKFLRELCGPSLRTRRFRGSSPWPQVKDLTAKDAKKSREVRKEIQNEPLRSFGIALAASAEIAILSSGDGDSQLAQPVAGLQGFRRVRIALNHPPQFGYAFRLFAQFDQRKTFLELR